MKSKFTTTRKGSADVEKQTAFAHASALTLTAKEIQPAVVKEIRGTFTVRTNWDIRGPYAVKTQAAKKTDWPRPFALVGTAADFLEKFMKGPPGSIEIKLPRGNFIAIPTTNVRRTKRDLIRAAQRPRNLRGKRDILLPMRSGKGFVLFQEQGRGKSAKRVALYILVRRARIREKDVLAGPAEKIFAKRFGPILGQQMEKAFATAR
jgi:hypothetical protein